MDTVRKEIVSNTKKAAESIIKDAEKEKQEILKSVRNKIKEKSKSTDLELSLIHI